MLSSQQRPRRKSKLRWAMQCLARICITNHKATIFQHSGLAHSKLLAVKSRCLSLVDDNSDGSVPLKGHP